MRLSSRMRLIITYRWFCRIRAWKGNEFDCRGVLIIGTDGDGGDDGTVVGASQTSSHWKGLEHRRHHGSAMQSRQGAIQCHYANQPYRGATLQTHAICLIPGELMLLYENPLNISKFFYYYIGVIVHFPCNIISFITSQRIKANLILSIGVWKKQKNIFIYKCSSVTLII